jgi:hypothetical protein
VPKVTVAIATYNGKHLLATVLESLQRQTYTDLRTVVVDDASEDGTVEWMAERWPDVRVVAHAENRGVAAAFNSCVEAASGEYLLLLNNDVELDPGCIAALVADLQSHPDAAQAGAKLLDFSRRDLLDGTGDVYSWAGLAYRRGQGESDRGQYDGLRDVFGACGAVALYRSGALATVGGFDERFFALCEDVDWSFRARLAGFECRYVPEAVAYHVGSASLGPRVSDFTLYHNWRNQIWVVVKNYPSSALALHAFDLLLGQLATLLVALRLRMLCTLLRAWRDALRELRPVLAQRRAIQGVRRSGRSELEPVIEGSLRRLRWWLLGPGRTASVAQVPPPNSR